MKLASFFDYVFVLYSVTAVLFWKLEGGRGGGATPFPR